MPWTPSNCYCASADLLRATWTCLHIYQWNYTYHFGRHIWVQIHICGIRTLIMWIFYQGSISSHTVGSSIRVVCEYVTRHATYEPYSAYVTSVAVCYCFRVKCWIRECARRMCMKLYHHHTSRTRKRCECLCMHWVPKATDFVSHVDLVLQHMTPRLMYQYVQPNVLCWYERKNNNQWMNKQWIYLKKKLFSIVLVNKIIFYILECCHLPDSASLTRSKIRCPYFIFCMHYFYLEINILLVLFRWCSIVTAVDNAIFI